MSEQDFTPEDMSDEMDAMTDELGSVEQQTSQIFVRTLTLWFFRWVIGFAIIALVTWFKPQWSWLWWAGLAVATASLLFTLVMQFFLQRRMAEMRETEARLEAALAKLVEDED